MTLPPRPPLGLTQALTRLHVARGMAVHFYAVLEQVLCGILAQVAGTANDVAATIFFKVTSTRSRTEILDKLYKRKYGNAFRPFWNSYLKSCAQLDQQRNAVVHWIPLAPEEEIKAGTFLPKLRPPNLWVPLDDKVPALGVAELMEFVKACDFHSTTGDAFLYVLKGHPPPPEGSEQAWRDIFERPLAYPPPDTHPLAQIYKVPATLPESFEWLVQRVPESEGTKG